MPAALENTGTNMLQLTAFMRKKHTHNFVCVSMCVCAGLEEEAAPVLQVMRRYMRTFFGCGECGRHFEQAAASSMDQVENKEDQILWLWDQHNRVNSRLAGKLGISFQ